MVSSASSVGSSVSYFMTHCGWNSTLEALSCGVPPIAMAQWVDQITNSKFIEDAWGVGVKVKAGENGIVKREEVAKCIEEVSEGDKGIKLKRNACKLKKLALRLWEKVELRPRTLTILFPNLCAAD
ncbi:hypothetical protein BUALT_Bualt09G0003700 [Buddleja alternifolia]|uniref:Uncharacterized protein n=1 Tax=Buddleja alternifolia TaxID=168488 RepID=A0AAV6X5D6_9LAMI|nr:hypothetical protein BUALT_Bualt09G0003700 [Buddleja alternifolia]